MLAEIGFNVCFHLGWVYGMGKRRHSLGILSLEFLKYQEVSKVRVSIRGVR